MLTRCQHILKMLKNVTAAKSELAFTRYRHYLKTVGDFTVTNSLQSIPKNLTGPPTTGGPGGGHGPSTFLQK